MKYLLLIVQVFVSAVASANTENPQNLPSPSPAATSPQAVQTDSRSTIVCNYRLASYAARPSYGNTETTVRIEHSNVSVTATGSGDDDYVWGSAVNAYAVPIHGIYKYAVNSSLIRTYSLDTTQWSEGTEPFLSGIGLYSPTQRIFRTDWIDLNLAHPEDSIVERITHETLQTVPLIVPAGDRYRERATAHCQISRAAR